MVKTAIKVLDIVDVDSENKAREEIHKTNVEHLKLNNSVENGLTFFYPLIVVLTFDHFTHKLRSIIV